MKFQDGRMDSDALNLLGIKAARSGCADEAAGWFRRAILAAPDDPRGYSNLGNVLRQLGRPTESLACYDHAIAIKPDYAEAHNNRGNTLRALQRWDDAVASFRAAIQFAPEYAEAHFNLAVTQQDLHLLGDAVDSYERALAVNPGYAAACNNLGALLRELRRHDAALTTLERALALAPGFAEAHTNLGLVLLDLQRPQEALASHERALALRPDFAEAFNNRGNALRRLKRSAEAVASYERALAIRPGFAEALNNLGGELMACHRAEEAVECFDRALAIKPNYADALSNRGNALQSLRRWDQALIDLEAAARLDPDLDWLQGALLHAKTCLCSWEGLPAAVENLTRRIHRGEKAAHPFALLALQGDAALQRRAAEIWVQHQCPPNPDLGDFPLRQPGEKIRIGYFSPDFRDHPVARLTVELFELHDRSRFEVFAFAYGRPAQGRMRRRLEWAFDHFIDVGEETDLQIARRARACGLDIAIDLGGHTQDCRPGIMALRAAPLQISYVGYLGTMGADYIDYLVADRDMVPPEDRIHYAEKIIELPSYQANDSRRCIGDRVFTRAELGLAEDSFVYCCFNASYKIMPACFDAWMRILKRVPASSLLLHTDSDIARVNLRDEARRRDVDPDRIVFAGRVPYADYLARFLVADLFLDTQPYNGGATVSDSLWAGLPVLTMSGDSFAGRMAAGLLRAIHMPELIASDLADYEDKAVRMGLDRPLTAHHRQRVADHRLTTPLFDTPAFTRSLETAFADIHRRHRAGLPAEDLRLIRG